MSIYGIALRNVWRNKFRVVLTILGVAIAIVAFVALRTVIDAWEVGVENAAKDRIGTRHKVSFVMDMPKRYIEVVRAVPGVQAATFAVTSGCVLSKWTPVRALAAASSTRKRTHSFGPLTPRHSG